MERTDDYVKMDFCDRCGKLELGRLYHCRGTPVLQSCRHCDPAPFEALVKEEVDRWLSGEKAEVHPSVRD